MGEHDEPDHDQRQDDRQLDTITPPQANCWNNIGNCSWMADGAIPAGVPTAFTVAAANDIDPDWDDAMPYLQFTIARVGASSSDDVGQSSAALTAVVHPNGRATTGYFEYGTTTGYGSATAAQDLGSGTIPVTMTASLDSLACGATYHYRAVATAGNETSAGADATLTTLPCGAPAMVAAGDRARQRGGRHRGRRCPHVRRDDDRRGEVLGRQRLGSAR